MKKENLLLLSSFSLKILALIFMTIDHIGAFLFPSISIYRKIGRIAFPLFSFQCSKSIHYSQHKKRYLLTLLLVAVSLETISFIYLKEYLGNIFFTLFLGCLLCYLYSSKNKYSKILFSLALLICTIPHLINYNFVLFEYGLFGVLLIFSFYIFDIYKWYQISAFILLTIFFKETQRYQLINNIDLIYPYYALLSIPFILMYNNKRGYDNKAIRISFYIYYPLHLLTIFIITELL